jgi:hypothetical protein
VTTLDVATGLVRWQKKLDTERSFRLAVAGSVYLLGSEGEVQVLGREHGEPIWSWSHGKYVYDEMKGIVLHNYFVPICRLAASTRGRQTSEGGTFL